MYLALVLVGIFARLFLENSISTASLAKTNFHQHFIQGESIMIFWNELSSLRGVWRSPDWLTH